MKTLKRHQLERLQKMIRFSLQEEIFCEPKEHSEHRMRTHRLTQLIFKNKL